MEILVLTLVKTHNYCYINYTILQENHVHFFTKRELFSRSISPVKFQSFQPVHQSLKLIHQSSVEIAENIKRQGGSRSFLEAF